MTNKERLKAAVSFKEVDRLPVIYRGTPYIDKQLLKKFKIINDIGDYDLNIMVKKRKEFLENLGADFWSYGAGLTALSTFVPKYTGPKTGFFDRGYFSTLGIKFENRKVSEKYDYSFPMITHHPWQSCESPGEIKGSLTKKMGNYDFKTLVNSIVVADEYPVSDLGEEIYHYQAFENNEDDIIGKGRVLSMPFMMCAYLRGMDKFLLDMAGNKKMADAIVNEVNEFVIEFNTRYLNESDYCQGDYFNTWDDVCMQNGALFSPDSFKKYFIPTWKKLIDIVKSRGMIFHWHCCGNVNDILPMMIDAGIDVFGVLQTSAENMDLKTFYKKFGKDVCVHGGIDVQKLMIEGTPKEIREEVAVIKELWGTGGGMLAGPSHELLPETPIENILALYDALS